VRCKKCQGKLQVARSCWKVRMRCQKCGAEYEIGEVADQLDEETEEALANYPTIIYR